MHKYIGLVYQLIKKSNQHSISCKLTSINQINLLKLPIENPLEITEINKITPSEIALQAPKNLIENRRKTSSDSLKIVSWLTRK
jgi:hypothetical protein